jgi:hypothetical protein
MSKSPLSGAFSGSSEPAKKKNKKNGAILLVAGVALATSIGGVFAANSITINSVEFGQGVADTVSCTDNATTVLSQAWSTDKFIANVITLTTEDDCSGEQVRVSLIDSEGEVLHSEGPVTGPAAATPMTFDVSTEAIEAGGVAKITVTTE